MSFKSTNRESANESYASDNVIHQQISSINPSSSSTPSSTSTVSMITKNSIQNKSDVNIFKESDSVSDNGNYNLVKVANSFTKIGCISCGFADIVDFEKCFGCKQSYDCICFEADNLCFKSIIDHPKACFICFSGKCAAFNPMLVWKWYLQCCCFECFCSIPSNIEDIFRITTMKLTNIYTSETIGDSILCQGCGCCSKSCNFTIPSCFGFYRKGVCLCCEGEDSLCKLLCWDNKRKNKNTCCLLYHCNYLVVKPYTFCKCIAENCFLDTRCACPCDDEVPCVVTFIPFCTFCVQGKIYISFFQTINDLVIAVGGNTTTLSFANNQTIITLDQQSTEINIITTEQQINNHEDNQNHI